MLGGSSRRAGGQERAGYPQKSSSEERAPAVLDSRERNAGVRGQQRLQRRCHPGGRASTCLEGVARLERVDQYGTPMVPLRSLAAQSISPLWNEWNSFKPDFYLERGAEADVGGDGLLPASRDRGASSPSVPAVSIVPDPAPQEVGAPGGRNGDLELFRAAVDLGLKGSEGPRAGKSWSCPWIHGIAGWSRPASTSQEDSSRPRPPALPKTRATWLFRYSSFPIQGHL